MATIHDVAVQAGVSTATVSRALNGKDTVDPQLAARVLTAARQLGYLPNGVARSLRRQTTAVWALIIADIENPFFTSIARGVEDVAQARGYSIVLCNSDENIAKESDYLQVAVQDRVAGVLLSPTSPQTEAGVLAERDIPVVAIDRPLGQHATDTVLVGSREGACRAAEHLMEQGYQRIACITGPEELQTAQERLEGYRDALRAAGRAIPAEHVRHADFKMDGGRDAARALMNLDQRPDAVVVANSLMTAGVLQVLQDLKLRPGSDMGLVGFDDAPWMRLVEPPLSTVEQPTYEIGRAAAELLIERLEHKERWPRTVMLETQLVVRGSSQRHG